MRAGGARAETARGHRGAPVALAAALAALLVLTGCGIRATEVPTEFGPAPSRSSCALRGDGSTAHAATDVPVRVYLLCSSRLVVAARWVRPARTQGAGAPQELAKTLLSTLRAGASEREHAVGYTSEVTGDLTVVPPRPGDPGDALRLSTAPEDLPAPALAQLICTLADTVPSDGAARKHPAVTLGGPDAEPLRRYPCTAALKDNPATGSPESTRVGS